MIDTHCHFEIEDNESFLKELKEIKEVGVNKLIVSCCTKEEQEKNIPFLEDKQDIYLALGYHPEEADSITNKDLILLEKKLKEINNVVALGEIGLDYFYTKQNKEKQIELFEKQLSLAQKLSLPVIIHSRDATEDTINCLKKYSVKGVIHCFSGSLETANIYTQMGFLLGIGGVLTFKNSHLKDVIKEIPLSSIILETDSPYLAPQSHRGEKNSPKYLPIIASYLAEVKEIPLNKLQEQIELNCKNMFSID